MFNIIYNAGYYAVFYASWSLAGGAIPILFFFLLYRYLQQGYSSIITISLLLIFLLIATVLFVHSAARRMVTPKPMKFLPGMKWQSHHLDFFMFTCTDIILNGAVTYLCARTAKYLYDYSILVELEHANEYAKAISSGVPPDLFHNWYNGVFLVSYGSKALAIVALFLAIRFWRHFFRLAVKIPAFTAGYNLSGKEALALTNAGRWEILVMSGLVNIGLWAFLPAFLFDSGDWKAAATAAAAYWVFIHANIALCTSFYQEYTSGYTMYPHKKYD